MVVGQSEHRRCLSAASPQGWAVTQLTALSWAVCFYPVPRYHLGFRERHLSFLDFPGTGS